MIDFATIERLTRYTCDTVDAPCPECGPNRRDPRNRTREVLKIWRSAPDFATFNCSRCGIKGHVRRDDRGEAKPHGVRDFQPAAKRAHVHDPGPETQASKAAALWLRRQPAAGTLAEMYLRRARGFGGSIPTTVAFLRSRTADHHPAMITAFGLAAEAEPSQLTPPATVTGVHLTLLRPDGLGKATVAPCKIMVGPSAGLPIVLAPINDALGLIVCEGIETALSLAEATGCGVWAAGAAGRMPALADKVPAWIDVVTIAAEPDDAGRKGAAGLAERLKARGIYSETKILTGRAQAA